MFSTSLVTLFLALACTAHPLVNVARTDSPISLPFAKKYNFTHSTRIADRDRARFKALTAPLQSGPNRTEARDGSEQLTNTLVSYTAQVLVGTPAIAYNLIVDTGSANTWIGAEAPCRFSRTAKATGDIMSVTYGTGSFTGLEVLDVVSIGNLNITNQPIGKAFYSKGFQGVDGILGIGPTDLTRGTLVADSEEEVATVTDTAYSDGLISSKIVGISFEPTAESGEVNGEITFGFVDTSKYTGDLDTIPITATAPANQYVGINQSITYGEENIAILHLTAGIVDTGTSLLLLPTDAYNNYINATGATLDTNVGLLSLPADQYDNLKSLHFHINGKTYDFTNNAQIWPRSLNSQIGGSSEKIYLIVGDGGSSLSEGLDFINGQAFLERFYTTYDSDNNEFGIAETQYTYATTN